MVNPNFNDWPLTCSWPITGIWISAKIQALFKIINSTPRCKKTILLDLLTTLSTSLMLVHALTDVLTSTRLDRYRRCLASTAQRPILLVWIECLRHSHKTISDLWKIKRAPFPIKLTNLQLKYNKGSYIKIILRILTQAKAIRIKVTIILQMSKVNLIINSSRLPPWARIRTSCHKLLQVVG